ncbi:homoserine kinase [Acidipila sp. EB88]|uniref:homoserine kinase n=1 Tax=Acidipila sp. EB88 TaxID=2305226 RepID=UPI0013158F04|nr:homoserine kinase [Acidipila sp. EB88]
MSAAIPAPIRLRLPATSANLGPGFDAIALALALYLEVDARPIATSAHAVLPAFQIEASGRSVALCSALTGNLLLDTYRETWMRHAGSMGSAAIPLHLSVRNGIPLGMGCGSSAASRFAGVALASHFAGLGWDQLRMLEEVAALEHHPDNAAACCLGGFVVSGYLAADATPEKYLSATPPAMDSAIKGALTDMSLGGAAGAQGSGPLPATVSSQLRVRAVSIHPPASWYALLVLPERPFATVESRAVLPEQYGLDAIVPNLQNVALLVAAFGQGRGDLLHVATTDRLHQPFRGKVCPLLPRLLPLAGSAGILSVTLSGAGSGVLCLLESEASVAEASARVLAAAAHSTHSDGQGALPIAELLPCALATGAAILHAEEILEK